MWGSIGLNTKSLQNALKKYGRSGIVTYLGLSTMVTSGAQQGNTTNPPYSHCCCSIVLATAAWHQSPCCMLQAFMSQSSRTWMSRKSLASQVGHVWRLSTPENDAWTTLMPPVILPCIITLSFKPDCVVAVQLAKLLSFSCPDHPANALQVDAHVYFEHKARSFGHLCMYEFMFELHATSLTATATV